MKPFFLGALGAVVVLILFFAILAEYSDYTARSQTDGWLNEVMPVQETIERLAIERNALAGIAVTQNASLFSLKNADLFEVSSTGTIALRGGSDGQFVLLTPALADGRVIWRCVGGSAKAMPRECKEGTSRRRSIEARAAADVDTRKLEMLGAAVGNPRQ